MVILNTTLLDQTISVTELTDDQLDELIIKGKLFEEEEDDEFDDLYIDLGGEG